MGTSKNRGTRSNAIAKTVAKAVAKSGKSIAARVLELVKAKKSNAQVWVVLQKEYGCGENHKHYPSWYRSHLRRRGLVK